jgi:lipopolysaccharide/colanic/teichoic acid biosynthesis glycosyltransferase
MKRVFDCVTAGLGLVILSPLLLVLAFLIWLQDYHSPFYIASRTGKDQKPYNMMKFRSMVIRADRSGVDSTAADDTRITAVGRFVRRFKLDELPQLWNVLKGEMSLVGPRPNVKRETDIYTGEEKLLLSIRPGITDIASIVFSDEGEILAGSADPDLRYNQVIRPWKSRLGLLYVKNAGSLGLDIRLIRLTILNSINRGSALSSVAKLVERCGGDQTLIDVALRRSPLRASPPPGQTHVVTSRARASA